MLIYRIYLHHELMISTSDHAYACEWIDRFKRKLGIDNNACHAEAEILYN